MSVFFFYLIFFISYGHTDLSELFCRCCWCFCDWFEHWMHDWTAHTHTWTTQIEKKKTRPINSGLKWKSSRIDVDCLFIAHKALFSLFHTISRLPVLSHGVLLNSSPYERHRYHVSLLERTWLQLISRKGRRVKVVSLCYPTNVFVHYDSHMRFLLWFISKFEVNRSFLSFLTLFCLAHHAFRSHMDLLVYKIVESRRSFTHILLCLLFK